MQQLALSFSDKAPRSDGLLQLERLLRAIAAHEGHNSVFYAHALDQPLASTRRYLKHLKQAGVIVFVGAPRKGGYFLSPPTRQILA